MLRLIAITPIKDEEKFLPSLIDSFKSQTLRPLLWIIVDDGSVDRSSEIIADFAKDSPWTKVITMPAREQRVRGAAIVKAIQRGLEECRDFDYDLILKVDADVSFESHLFLELVERMSQNARIGICGPELLIKRSGNWEVERDLPYQFVRGPFRIYRRCCLEDIGGLIPKKGWDGIDQIKAQTMGWTVERYSDLTAFLEREIGQATGFAKAAIENGRGSYFMGAGARYMLREAIEFSRQRPYLIKGLFLIVGYFLSFIKSDRIDDKQVIDFIRKQHKELLRSK